jgi:cell division protein FtsB
MNRNKDFRLAVSTLVLFLVLAGIHLFLYAQNINLTYRINDQKIKLNETLSRRRQLDGQAARGEDLPLIEKKALALKMIYPEKIHYVIVSRKAGVL